MKKQKRIWKLAPVQWDGQGQQRGSIKEWWNKLGNAINRKDMSDRIELSAYIMWQIWKNRNNWIFNSEKLIEIEVVNKAWAEWLEYKDAQPQVQLGSSRQIRVEEMVV